MSDIERILADAAARAGLGAEGTVPSVPRFLMAPMAGVTDGAYRLMARAGGAGLAYSEMVSVAGLHYRSQKTWELAEPVEGEPELAVQLFGAEPDQFAEAAAKVTERLGSKLALIDINMACPMPKVTKGGAGAALLDDPERAAHIVQACRAHTTVPVTVKIRRGRRMDEEVAPEFARRMADAGVAAVAVHGRYANQLYLGEASWEAIRRVAAAVDVPVIGSGDVRSAADAVRMLTACGCAQVMIARGSYGNPWIFGQATELMAGAETSEPTVEQRIAAFECHVRLLAATGAHMARARSLAGWYLRGLPHAAAWRKEAMSCVTEADFLDLARRMSATLAQEES